MMKKIIVTIGICIFAFALKAQSLQSGFNGKEYLEMLSLSFQHFDSAVIDPKIPVPDSYYNVYRSPVVGFKNIWNMWYRKDDKLAVICIRGTIGDMKSWLANFYGAMVPTKGSIQLNDSTIFNYQLAANEKAQVHVGWTIASGCMAPTMIEQIKIAYQKGIREFIITGHSQGGALSTLTRSYLFYLQQKNEIPTDIIFKTYCSASPKVGNIFYAYDFDFINCNGWAFTIVNGADWVPETPFSIQRLTDFNDVNPFVHLDDIIKKQKFLVKLVLRSKYNKTSRTTRRAQENFENLLGHFVYKMVKKNLPQLKEPVYAKGNNYQWAGIPIVLMPDADYYQKFPNQTTNIFQHHMFEPYYMLAKKYYGQ